MRCFSLELDVPDVSESPVLVHMTSSLHLLSIQCLRCQACSSARGQRLALSQTFALPVVLSAFHTSQFLTSSCSDNISSGLWENSNKKNKVVLQETGVGLKSRIILSADVSFFCSYRNVWCNWDELIIKWSSPTTNLYVYYL